MHLKPGFCHCDSSSWGSLLILMLCVFGKQKGKSEPDFFISANAFGLERSATALTVAEYE